MATPSGRRAAPRHELAASVLKGDPPGCAFALVMPAGITALLAALVHRSAMTRSSRRTASVPTAVAALYRSAVRHSRFLKRRSLWLNRSLDRSVCVEFGLSCRLYDARRAFRSAVRHDGIGSRRVRGGRYIGECESRRDQHDGQTDVKHDDLLFFGRIPCAGRRQ
jgi:hypothetical protein